MTFKETLLQLLKTDVRLLDAEGELMGNKIQDLADKTNEKLIELLIENAETRAKFFIKIKEVYVFKTSDFKFYIDENKIDNSYTQYENRIGLTSKGKFLKDSNDVVLDFPYKDCILEGGQSTEEGTDTYFEWDEKNQHYTEKQAKRKEIFFNSVLAKDEIDRLLEPKAFANTKKYSAQTPEGATITNFERDENGTIKDNLIIKGNNLLVLHTLKKEFAGKVKLIYIDPPYNTGNDSFAYNDNFNHSTWLTFMRNRLLVARDLLREDGVIFVQCDDNEQAYLKVLLDEIFYKENFLNQVCAKMKQTSGASGGGEDKRLKKNIEYLIIFSKNRFSFENFNPIYDETDLISAIEDMKNDGKSWKYTRVIMSGLNKREFLKDIQDGSGESIKIYKHSNIVYKTISDLMKLDKLSEEECYFKYYDKIFRDTNAQSSIRTKVMEATKQQGDFFSIDYIPVSGRNKNKLTTLYYKGNNCDLIAWLSDICIKKKKKLVKLEKLGTFWDGFPLNNLTKEGNVQFANGKKPEALLKKILDLTTSEGDLILDYHLGSGTTAAVAHKMNRQYIGLEQMDYGENDFIKRLCNVINNEQSGISKQVNWQGGGSFIYLELAKNNQNAIDQIQNYNSYDELVLFFDAMCQKYFLHYNVKIKQFKDEISKEENFKKLSLEKQKELFIKMLDLNQLYVNVADMEDEKHNLTANDIAITNDFYQI